MASYGRNRQSIADIEAELNNIFDKHPKSHLNASGDPVIPADNLLDVLQSFSDLYDGQPLMTEVEATMLQTLLADNPGLEVTPQILLQFIAEKTKTSPPRSPGQEEYDDRGREDLRDAGYGHSRSRSNDSDGTSYYPGSHSRPPSRGPTTPGHSVKSPLDSERRQRSTPLVANAPSSWSKRPTPHGRRKSDAGSRSDSEGGTPSAWGRKTSGRTRTPSNPTSPSSSYPDLGAFSPGSPSDYPGPRSRPHSRNQSRNGYDHGYSSPDDMNHTLKRPMSRYGGYNNSRNNDYDNSFDNAVSSMPMPRNGNNSDSDDEDMVSGLVHERTTTSSTVSMEQHERMEAMQRSNEELGRKLMDAERTLQNKLEEHEVELEETHMRLEELRSELAASNRDEKELRAKDSRSMQQIASLEAELAKVQKALDSAKLTYSSLQKQYQEQCSVSEKYRDDLRRREETIRSLKDAASLHELETSKWQREHEAYEERISKLEEELNIAMQAHTQLDEQKQENLLLKETIDRMRFEMDEMRASMAMPTGGPPGGSGQSSAANSLSKSLGAELAGKMRWDEDMEEEGDSLGSEISTAVDEDEEVTEGEDEEDVIQTIITKRKRKVASRANVMEPSTRNTFDELKEYSDSSTQYDPTLFAVNHGMQTEAERKPVKMSFSIQTDEIPEPKPLPVPPPRITMEMEIQTESIEEPEPSRSPSPAHDESMASSSSTIVPPTPKAKLLDPLDEPPAYVEAEQEERVAADTLRKWHIGAKIPFEGVRGGVSEEAIEEWKTLKLELGVECAVIDKIIAASATTSSSASTSAAAQAKAGTPPATVRRGGRFYNIYNTYVYGDKTSNTPQQPALLTSSLASQAMMFVGASALVILAITPYMMPHYSVPGGATYYDRAAWNSFNSMQAAGEGFSPDGTAAVWNFLGRVGGGAARIARGWPT